VLDALPKIIDFLSSNYQRHSHLFVAHNAKIPSGLPPQKIIISFAAAFSFLMIKMARDTDNSISAVQRHIGWNRHGRRHINRMRHSSADMVRRVARTTYAQNVFLEKNRGLLKGQPPMAVKTTRTAWIIMKGEDRTR
jgi:hypothetical protein